MGIVDATEASQLLLASAASFSSPAPMGNVTDTTSITYTVNVYNKGYVTGVAHILTGFLCFGFCVNI